MKELYCTIRSRWLAKKIRNNCALAVLLLVAGSADAQILVETTGAATNSFNTTPLPADWATFDTTTGAAGTYETPAALDTGAQTIDASVITTALPTTAANGTARLARHNTAGTYLVTQPTGVPWAMLKATLRNNSGGGVASIRITYDYSIPVAPVTDAVPGQRVFWSLTGAPNSWTLIPEFSGITTAGPLSATLSLGSWAPGTDMYILFLDDNNLTGADGAHAIDNFAVTDVVPSDLTCVDILSGASSLTVPERGAASFSIMATGSPQTIRWYRSDNGGGSYTEIPGAAGSTYAISSTVFPGDNGARFFATISNSVCQDTSTVAILTVQPDVVGPTLIRGVGSYTNTIVNLTFSEPLDVNTINEANFTVYPTGSDPEVTGLVTLGFTFTDGTNVTILTDPRADGVNYSVRLLDVRDASSGNNLINPNPRSFPLLSQSLLIGLDENNEWKYFVSTNIDLWATAPDWYTPGYDDSDPVMWPSGPAPLGNDGTVGAPQPDIRTTIPYSGALPAAERFSEPAFFRRHFFLPSGTNGLVLQMRHLFEDGGIVFINGKEAGRFNVASNAALSFTTRAAANATDPTPVSAPVSLALSNVVPGDNVIAVVVVQNGNTSSDSVFTLELVATFSEFASGPPRINAHPEGQTVLEGANVILSVSADGALPLTYHWRKDGNPAPGANVNSPVYSLFGILPSQAGSYSVIVSNSLGTSNSLTAVVNVTADTFPPVFVSAIGNTNLTNITLTITDQGTGLNFETATNPASWTVALTAGGGPLTVESAVRTSASNVVLTTSPRTPMTAYTVTGIEVVDRSAAQNALTPSSRDLVATEQVIGFGATWRYDQSGTDLGLAWKDVGYNDTAWPSGPGVLGFEDTLATLTFFTNIAGGSGTNTVLSQTNQTGAGVNGTNVTFYFRSTVNLSFDPNAAGNSVRVRAVIDDGAILYVNGVEQLRFNMTNGPGYTNLANAASTEGAGGLVVSNVGGFVQGDNLIAVEVHQSSVNSSDLAFALELEGLLTTFGVDPRPRLRITRGPGAGQLTISWTGGGVLQETTALSNDPTWTDVGGNPQGTYTFTPTGEKRFFSLRQ